MQACALQFLAHALYGHAALLHFLEKPDQLAAIFLPLIHQQRGLWWAMAFMVVVAIALVLVFWRKRYLARTAR